MSRTKLHVLKKPKKEALDHGIKERKKAEHEAPVPVFCGCCQREAEIKNKGLLYVAFTCTCRFKLRCFYCVKCSMHCKCEHPLFAGE